MRLQRDKMKVFFNGRNESMVTCLCANEPVKREKLLMQERGAQMQVVGRGDGTAWSSSLLLAFILSEK